MVRQSDRLKGNNRNHIFRMSDRMQNKDRENKVAKTLWVVTSVLLLCWSLIFIVYSIYLSDIKSIHYLMNELLIWLGLCNSAINIMIYA